MILFPREYFGLNAITRPLYRRIASRVYSRIYIYTGKARRLWPSKILVAVRLALRDSLMGCPYPERCELFIDVDELGIGLGFRILPYLYKNRQFQCLNRQLYSQTVYYWTDYIDKRRQINRQPVEIAKPLKVGPLTRALYGV